jgi:iron(III) transport system permease protein
MAGLSTTNYAGPPAARSDGVVAFNRSRLIQIIIALVTVTLVFAPIVPILYQSFLDRPLYDHEAAVTGQNYINLFASPVIWQVVFNSLLFAAATTIIAQIIGTFLAILVGRTDLPGRRILGDVILLPMFLSHLVLAFGWFIAYGPSGYITIWINNIVGGAPGISIRWAA